MKVITSFIFCLLFILQFSSAQKTVQGLNDYLKSVQAGSKLPGFALAIIKDETVIFSGSYGFADKATKTPYTLKTIQPVGSVSKTVIALAVMQCVEKGLFSLETPINDLLPFKVINPNSPASIIKVKDLVTHTSGIIDKDDTYQQLYTPGKKPAMDLKDLLKAYLTEGGALYNTANFAKSEPGKKYDYSNLGASLAAYIVEVKTKIPFEKYTTQNIFDPMKLEDTHWFYDEARSKRYATLYEVNTQYDPLYKKLINSDGSLKVYSNSSYPDGSLRSSVADLTKYLTEMIKGFYGKSKLMSKKSFDALFAKQFTPVNMPATMDPREPNRAVFWAFNRKGKISHTGSDPGIAAFISFDPISKIGRILLINTQLEGKDNIVTIEAFVNLTRGLDNFEKDK